MHKKVKKRNTNSEPSIDEDNVHEACLDTKLVKNPSEKSHKPFMEKFTMILTENKLQKISKPNTESLIEIAVKTTVQVLYDEALNNKYDIADEILNDYLSREYRKDTEVIERRQGSRKIDKND